MTGIVAFVLVGLGIFLFWFGYEVTSGKYMVNPKDKLFPLMGRNIDYVIGVAGIPMALGMFILAFGIWVDILMLNYVAAAFVLFGIVRAYLPPDKYGPSYYRKFVQKDKVYRSRRAKLVARKRRKK
jgi:hypothetical protein